MTYLTMKGFNKLPLPPLNFTANTAGSTVRINKVGSPTAVTLEYSTDNSTWSTYTFGTDITLTNIWDKVYFRNTSETDTGFSVDTSYYYQFAMTWSISASGDITTLLNKNWTDTASEWCFNQLFGSCSSLTSSPSIPITILAKDCFYFMFNFCSNLETLPKLPALTLPISCYNSMFFQCPKIKVSTSKTWEYQTEYRIPTTWTWTHSNQSLYNMFYLTWWTFTWTPSINTTYYTSNTLV